MQDRFKGMPGLDSGVVQGMDGHRKKHVSVYII